jgi:hypothetical protein
VLIPGGRHFVVRAAVQFAAASFRANASPLLEEEGGILISALSAEVVHPTASIGRWP